MEGILLHGLTAILYALLGFHFWRTRWRSDTAVEVAAWERVAVLAPLALHSWLLYLDLFAGPEFHFGFGQALSVTLWLAVLIYWLESWMVNLQGMHALVLPVAAIAAVLPTFFAGFEMPGYAQSFQFRAHLVVAMAAYSLFTLAAMHALLMSLLERRLHGNPTELGRRDGPFANLPPLLSLEALLFRMLWLGFILLTLTLASGVLFSETLFGQAFRFNHKTVFGVLSWLIFGALLFGRHMYGWRGRRALRWTLSGFVVLLLAYVGSRFVLEVLLHRAGA
jgi:ABC-type uncharacterized transport system permease subunit